MLKIVARGPDKEDKAAARVSGNYGASALYRNIAANRSRTTLNAP
jgi:hypothetical protein